MSSPYTTVIRVNRRFSASAEDVFDAWVIPLRAAKWLFATRMGRMTRAEIDARVGGRFYLTERRNREPVEHTGKFLEVDRPRRLVFTFSVPKASANSDRVTVDLKPLEPGCELTLTQETKLPLSTPARQIEGGWLKMMEELAAVLEEPAALVNHKAGVLSPRGEIRFVRLLPGPIENVWAYLTEPGKRATWFAGGPMELRAGGRVDLRFHHANLAPGETPPAEFKEVHDPGLTSTSHVVRSEPPRLLSFTWNNAAGEETSEVTFELTPQGTEVQLVLTHRKLTAGERADVACGWHLHLSLLVAQLYGRKPAPFWSTHAQLQAEYAYRELQTRDPFTEPLAPAPILPWKKGR